MSIYPNAYAISCYKRSELFKKSKDSINFKTAS